MSLALENLKSQLKALGGFYEREFLHNSNEEISIPKGAITQVVGPGKTEALVKFLAQSAPLKIAWIEDSLSIYPNAILQRQLNLNRILFTEAGKDYVWASLQILASSLFDVVILSLDSTTQIKDLRTLRRLQLAAEKSKCSFILLVDQAIKAWPISLHLESLQNLGWRVIRAQT